MNECLICHNKFETGKRLSNHIKKEHKLNGDDYTTRYLYEGIRPTCNNCGDPTRRVGYAYKKYCAGCSKIASKIGGKKGGKAPNPRRGKTKNDDDVLMAASKRMMGKGNHFFGKKHTEKTLEKISKTKLLTRLELIERVKQRSDEFKLLTTHKEYTSRQQQYLRFQCRKCKKINRKTLQAFERGSACEKCNPVGTSQGERELAEWLIKKGFTVKRSDRTIIGPKEIDIAIHNKKIAIEFDGLYWHSELSPKGADRHYHREKTRACLESGWSLIHIFSDDWSNKKDIVKSMLLHRLGKSSKQVSARSCQVVELDVTSRREFFNQSHASGDVASKKAWGLINKGTLVAAMSVRSPRQKRWTDRLEIARFASLPGIRVAGGLSKLLSRVKKFAVKEEKSGLISYADRRFGEGNSYRQVGFTKFGETGLDYWYTDGQVRVDRFSMRATKNLTELNRAQSLGMGRIWGCGSNIWLMEIA